MSPRRQPSPPLPPQETDPAVEVLATLITEQLVAILPGIITRIRNSEEFTRNFPLLAAEKKEPEEGETSRKRKRNRSKKSRNPEIHTEAIPLRQMAVAPESENRRCYAGKSTLCTNCHYHHRAEISCKQCIHCGKTNHWDHQCKSSMELVCKPEASKFPLCATCGLHHAKDKLCKHCLNCGGKGHWSRDCNNPPTHNQNPGNTTYPLPRHSKDCYVCGLSEHTARDCPVRISSTNPAPSKGKASLYLSCHYHDLAELSCVQCTRCGNTGHWIQQCRSPVASTPRQYFGAFPKCVKCVFHHGEEKPCKHCLSCGKYGHWIQQCRFISPRKREQKVSTSTSPQHNNNCFMCGMHGHFARDCSRKMSSADPADIEELLALPAPGEHSESDDSIGMQISA
ncbi:hypothetical protein E3N88_04217 [Mikania micrantha]|uniref:CCHC-type domain-containing protein n=1 Tax=Mikania micrantha TaxID=192012 RepID=A0A5N6PTT4_9ASTR|nr:hypothetical protein E3N88_04217 [Mikania micrantha]